MCPTLVQAVVALGCLPNSCKYRQRLHLAEVHDIVRAAANTFIEGGIRGPVQTERLSFFFNHVQTHMPITELKAVILNASIRVLDKALRREVAVME